MNPINYLRSALLGPAPARREHSRALASGASVQTGLEELTRICGTTDELDADSPIFLLSAGWRAGSTLLQRLIMSDANVVMWGEPYDECAVIQRMAEMLKAFRPGWPPADYYYGGAKPEAGDWVANFFPRPDALRRAPRAFFDAAFAEPAKKAGAGRWGIKEVRLGVEHAHYLRWLYPNSKLVFLYRNPLDAYQSYSRFGRNWYDVWPDRPMFTAAAFGRHWRTLAQGFLKAEKPLGALTVRYEDLVTADAGLIQRIDRHLGIKVDASILSKKVGSSEGRGGTARVSALEKALLRRAAAPLAQALGYRW